MRRSGLYRAPVAYDALVESTALIEHGLREDPLRLSRRRRFAALAVDVDDDVACTLFVVRGPGHFRFEDHVLVRRDGRWRVLGGGGSGSDTDGLADRPPAAALGRWATAHGAGSVTLDERRWLPWGARYVRYATLRASAEVHAVGIGPRVLAVPRHGHLVVVWSTPRPPVAELRDAAGRALGRLQLTAP